MLTAQAYQQPSPLAEASLWEEENATSAGHGDSAWLLSFIDILALLLTLFVLLLAYEANGPQPGDSASPVLEPGPAQREISAAVIEPALQPRAQVPVPFTVLDSLELLPIGTPAPVVRSVPAVISPPPAAQLASQPASAADDAPGTDRVASAGLDALPVASSPATNPVQESAAADQPLAESPLSHAVADSVQDAPLSVPAATVGGGAHDALLADLAERGLQQRLEVTVHSGMVNLAINDSILFDTASAALTEHGAGLIGELAAVLAELPYNLSVEGHTDNTPIQTARFPSNWELSSARAAAVTRKLIERGVVAERIRTVGYASTRPRADNETAAGRTRNRRVSFVLEIPATD